MTALARVRHGRRTSTISDPQRRGRSGSVLVAARAITVVRGGRVVLDRASLSARSGEVLALVGPNGAGKSTLLGALAGDLAVTGGVVEVDDVAVGQIAARDLARRRAVLPQDVSVAFPFTVHDVVAMGRAPWLGTTAADLDDQVVSDAISAMDLGGLRDRPVPQLSGGERARTAMARVLAQDTQVLLLDEPTAALDLHHQERLLAAVRARADAGGAVVVVLHDLTQAGSVADRIAIVASGRVVADGPPTEVLDETVLGRTYHHPITVHRHPMTNQPVVVPQSLHPSSPQ